MVELELREIAVSDWEIIERIGRLRIRAWRIDHPQISAATSWLDDFDRTARHWAFLRGGEPWAAARMSVHPCIEKVPDCEGYVGVFGTPPPQPIASFNRLVVDKSVRGLGLSQRLDAIRLTEAKRMGCKCAIGATPSGERRVNQMMRSGFVFVGIGNLLSRSPVCSTVPPSIMICHLTCNPVPTTVTHTASVSIGGGQRGGEKSQPAQT